MDNTIICESCEALKDYAPDYLLNGVTEIECGNLQQNKGLTAQPTHDNYEDIQDIINCGVFGMDQMIQASSNCDWKEVMRKLSNNVANILSSINCGDLGQWEAIEALRELIQNINQRLTNIENRLSSIELDIINIKNRLTILEGRLDDLEKVVSVLSGSISYTYLTLGVDYECIMHNGFTTNYGSPRVGIAETGSEYLIEISSPAGEYRVTNPNMTANNVQQSHGTPTSEIPTSWIYSIRFIGKYASLNSYPFRNTSGATSGTWNLRPLEARASWSANCSLTQGPNNITGYYFTCVWVGYADGYNSQLTAYLPTVITSADLNLTNTGVIIKPSTRSAGTDSIDGVEQYAYIDDMTQI